MIAFTANIILTIIWACIFLNDKRYDRRAFVVIVSIQIFLLMALRSTTVGTDTWNYENNYTEVRTMDMYSWRNIFHNLFFNNGTYNGRDAGFYIIFKTFSTIIPSFRVFLCIISFFFVYSIGRFMYRYADDIFMSYLIYEAFFLTFFFSAMRQSIAICLVMFWGYELIRKKHFWRFLILCLIGMSIHTSAIIALPFYFFCNKKRIQNGKCMKYVIALVISAVFALFSGVLQNAISINGVYSSYNESSSIGSRTFIYFYMVVTVGIMILDYMGQFQTKRIDTNTVLYGFIISEILFSSAMLRDILFRMGIYYAIYGTFAIAEAVDSFGERARAILRTFISFALILYVARTSINYQLFFIGG